jgi:hypothetical protein
MPTLTGCSVCFKRAVAIAKSFSRGSASIAIAAEFFWVSVMVVFMVACGLQKYTPCCKDFDFGSECTLSTTSPVNFRNFALPKDAITCNSPIQGANSLWRALLRQRRVAAKERRTATT